MDITHDPSEAYHHTTPEGTTVDHNIHKSDMFLRVDSQDVDRHLSYAFQDQYAIGNGDRRMNQNPNNSPLLPTQRSRPQQIVSEIVSWIRAGIMLLVWIVLAAITLGVSYVALRTIIWAVQVTLKAVGL